ncbi:MAG: 23S rRNA (pseudouridine(1915)-N(3))-methyltransferase RlmH [Acidobacteriota bacterium]|nr:23S rRNA (pseudouridine(1915)-N(3))-methyltransferase RlmH [Acidobacteriota bacterium]
MKLKIAWIGKTKEAAIQTLTDEYLGRLSHYSQTEGLVFKDEESLLKFSWAATHNSRAALVLLDSKGKQLSSEDLAKFIGDHRDRSSQPLLFAVGPANGFSSEAKASATMLLSLGNMTIAHELARVVLLEQLYRAFTILKGHPYHLGH